MQMGGDGLVHGVADAPVDERFIELMRSKQAPYITTTTVYEAIADYAGFVRRQAAFDLLGLVTPAQVSQMTSPQTVEQVNARFGDLAAAGYQRALPTIRANAKRLFEAGVLVVAGTDTGVPVSCRAMPARWSSFPAQRRALATLAHFDAQRSTRRRWSDATSNLARWRSASWPTW